MRRFAAIAISLGMLVGTAGAVVGGVAGRRGSKKQQEETQAEGANDWARAFAACMESKGYSVK